MTHKIKCRGAMEPEGSEMDIFSEVFNFALGEMATIYKSRRELKGDSWQDMTPGELRVLFDHEIEEYNAANGNSLQELYEITDILNVGFMLYTRLMEERQK